MSSSGEPDSNYEQVRRRLIERGYLQGPIERFVLRDFLGEGARRWAAVRTALKAAVLGAPVVGAVPAAAAIAAHRPLLRLADGVVLWLYFAALAAAVLFVVDLAVASVASSVARRGRGSARTAAWAGAAVGVPLLAYLAFLWARRGARFGIVADVLFLLAALAAALAVTWLARLVSLAGIVHGSGTVPERSRTGVASLAVVLLPAAIALLVLARAGERGTPASPPVFEAADAPRMLMVGIDGLEAGTVTTLADTGPVEFWLRRLESGAVVPLRRPSGRQPAEVWTTIATGMPAEVHGIRSADAARLPGVSTPLTPAGGTIAVGAALRFLLPVRAVPTSGTSRRVRTAWEILGLARPVAAVGWWASWPVQRPPAGGYVIGDRTLAKLLAGLPGDRDVDPEALFDKLESEFPVTRGAIESEFRDVFRGIPMGGESVQAAREAFLTDAWNLALAERLHADPGIAATFVYLPGLDILRHRRARADAPTGESAATLRAYVAWLSRRTEALWAREPGALGVLVADPGRQAGSDSEGFLAMFGPGVRPGCVSEAHSITAVTPALLAMAGFPASDELDPVPAAVCLRAAASRPARVASYGRREPDVGPSDPESDREVLERLRSLGYVE